MALTKPMAETPLLTHEAYMAEGEIMGRYDIVEGGFSCLAQRGSIRIFCSSFMSAGAFGRRRARSNCCA